MSSLNTFRQLCPSNVPCPDNGHSNHVTHDLYCSLPHLYRHTTHWSICQYAIHPEITTWLDPQDPDRGEIP